MRKLFLFIFLTLIFSNLGFSEFCLSPNGGFAPARYEGSDDILNYIESKIEKINLNRLSDDNRQAQSRYQVSILERLQGAVNSELRIISHEQWILREFHSKIIMHGFGLGVCSINLLERLNDPSKLFSTSEFEELSDQELARHIQHCDERCKELVFLITKRTKELCTPDELERINGAEKTMNDMWDNFRKVEILDGKTYPELLGSDGTYEDTLFRHNSDLATQQAVQREMNRNRSIYDAFVLFTKIAIDDAGYQRELGPVVLKNMQLFRDDLEELSSLFEKRAILEALKQIRKWE